MTEFLKCKHCETLNELESGWRSKGDFDDTHYITCSNCKRTIYINNRDFKSEFLINSPKGKYKYPVSITMDFGRLQRMQEEMEASVTGLSRISFTKDPVDWYLEKTEYAEAEPSEGTKDFLLYHEFDIANDEANFALLKNLFLVTFNREPRGAFRCPKCGCILNNIHYAIEDRYPFEGWRGWCSDCKKSVDVEDA